MLLGFVVFVASLRVVKTVTVDSRSESIFGFYSGRRKWRSCTSQQRDATEQQSSLSETQCPLFFFSLPPLFAFSLYSLCVSCIGNTQVQLGMVIPVDSLKIILHAKVHVNKPHRKLGMNNAVMLFKNELKDEQ